MKSRTLGVLILASVLVACSSEPPPLERATALYFVEDDSAADTTPVRMIVGQKFLRIDGGEEGKDFLLYDRAARVIYNVSATDRLILVIPARPAPSGKPPKLYHRTKRDTASFPAVGGRPVVHYRLITNGRLCYDLYAADGLLPSAVSALREYREALAGEQTAAIGFTPSEQKAPCDLTNHVYLPSRHLVHGFPVRLVEFDARDPKRRRVTELKNYRTEFEVAPDLFRLPEDFRRMNLKELRQR
jgi:hypothetical protein